MTTRDEQMTNAEAAELIACLRDKVCLGAYVLHNKEREAVIVALKAFRDLAALRALPQERTMEKDQDLGSHNQGCDVFKLRTCNCGAGIGQTIPDVEGTEPRPNEYWP